MEVKASKKELIRNAVLDTVAEVGLAGLTMKKIAVLAGISPATMYLYYKSKEEIINSLYKETKEELAKAATSRTDASLPFQINFSRMFDDSMHYLIHHQREMILQQQCAQSPYIDEATLNATDSYYIGIMEMLDKACAIGEVNPNMPSLLAMNFVHGIMQSAILSITQMPELESQSIIQSAFSFCWNAIKP